MPGEPIALVDDASELTSGFVAALAALPPTLPRWAVIGGFAVYVRLARVHRATADVDTMTLGQEEMVEVVVAQPSGERLRTGKVRLAGVDIDVMPVPGEAEAVDGAPSDRAFHLVRRHALASATQERVIVLEPAPAASGDRPATVRAEATFPVAGAGALVLLKAVALPRREGANRARKIVSDAQDLVRLVARYGLGLLIEEIRPAPPELGAYAGRVLTKRFGDDGLYLLAMLRRAGVIGIEVDDLALVARLGDLLIDVANA